MARTLEDLKAAFALAPPSAVGMGSSVFQQLLGQNANKYNYATPKRRIVTPTAAPNVASSGGGGGEVKFAGGHTPDDGHNHSGGKGLHPVFNKSLQSFLQASGGRVSVGSGYRSIAEQQVLYDRYRRGVKGQAPAAKPGRSNHNFGLAGDLKFANPGARNWAHANAARFGLRFPMSYEPWHIEPLNARALRGR